MSIFSRQTPLIGSECQVKLEETVLLIAGLGGLGCHAAELSARAGFGKLFLLDKGVVEKSDLNRQTLYTMKDLGKGKVKRAVARLNSYGLSMKVIGLEQEIDDSFILPEGIDGVLDCMDNFSARYVLDDRVHEKNVFLVHGAVNGFFGQLTTIVPGKTQSFREVFTGITDYHSGDIPVIGPVPSVIASIMVLEAVKVVGGLAGSLINKMLFLDFRDYSSSTISLKGKI